jgi:hypothetical protein
MGGVSSAGDYAVMKKNQDKRRSTEKAVSNHPDGTTIGKSGAVGKKSGILQITLVPFNLRSKF